MNIKANQQDSFWETIERVLFNQTRMNGTPQEAAEITALMEARPGQKLLDLCCGIGRHALEFARSGFKVTGVDRTQSYLDKAQALAEAQGLNMEWVNEDMRRFCRPAQFDLAVNLYSSFGFFDKPEEDRQVVKMVYDSLRPGGKFMVELYGKEVVAGRFRERDWYEDNGIIVLKERSISDDWGKIGLHWILFQGDKREEQRTHMRLYSAKELEAVFRECGFAKVESYGDFSGSPYDHRARTLVVIGTKE